MGSKWLIASVAAALAPIVGIAVARSQSAEPDASMADVLLEPLRQGALIEQYVGRFAGTVRRADRDGDGLDRDDVALFREQEQAGVRARTIGQVLRYDLDGDFIVTSAEIRRMIRGDARVRSKRVERELDLFDADGDGSITLAEAAASAVPQPGSNLHLGELVALDPNGDGKLTIDEMRHVAQHAFERVDRDRDSKISADEYAPIAERIRDIRRVRSAPTCKLPTLPDGAKLVVYGAYEGDSISSVAIGGQDKETNLTNVVIEPGSDPLYVVLTSYESMVWRVSGATDRVAHIVVSSTTGARTTRTSASQAVDAPDAATPNVVTAPPPARSARSNKISASGVIGLPATKVTVAVPNCPRYFYRPEEGDAKGALATLQRAVGHEVDAAFGSYSAGQVSLPSGQIQRADAGSAPMPSGFDEEMWRQATRFWPGGLASVDPKQVVAATRVEPYKVPPSQMGLSQLVGSGAVKRLSNGAFRIMRAIPRMPPSMGGAHSVTLILAHGVPLPPGDPVHSCVIADGSSRSASSGARCGIPKVVPEAPPVVTAD